MSGVTPRVLVDGIIYGQQKYGGISRYFTEMLSHIKTQSDNMQILLHLPNNHHWSSNKYSHIKEIQDWNLRPNRIFADFCINVNKMRSRLFRPDLFHSTYYTSPYWTGLKSVVTVHDFIYEKFPFFFPNAQRFIDKKKEVIEKADSIVAVSHCVKNDILKFTNVEESKIRVIYHGISDTFIGNISMDNPIDSFREFNNIKNPYWLFVGRREGYKNFGTLLRAFVKVSRLTKGHLVIVGGEPVLEPRQIDFLVKNNLEKKILLMHSVNDEILQTIYRGAEALIFPSLEEGFGIPQLEAMACKTPIIASNIPIFHEIADKAAIYFDPHSEEALAESMMDVQKKEIREPLISEGSNKIKRYSWDTCAKSHLSLYKDLI